jgi:hypothetical protein
VGWLRYLVATTCTPSVTQMFRLTGLGAGESPISFSASSIHQISRRTVSLTASATSSAASCSEARWPTTSMKMAKMYSLSVEPSINWKLASVSRVSSQRFSLPKRASPPLCMKVQRPARKGWQFSYDTFPTRAEPSLAARTWAKSRETFR